MWACVKVDLVFVVLITCMYSSPGKYIHEQNTQFWSGSLVLTQKYHRLQKVLQQGTGSAKPQLDNLYYASCMI